ncbi:MAG: ceramidase [Okeania sp. SIO3B5]|uniref:ceramidase domain-containing protein n=1 Tax=Okeania sp. SIO3B5 TaxID=2607811 RepID=UPI0014010B81|nr:ceramidase domain-containing protein [Okeania sp. SIO3B5]NEO52516.1 ceramidase [Okeania sp. SIO3B5]
MIDLYCERLQPSLWDEPINAISNIAFFIAAWVTWRLADNLNVQFYSVKLLIYLMIGIGIGSSLFHTYATGWALLMDVIPIMMFQLFYLWIYIRRVMKLKPIIPVILMLVLLISSLLTLPLKVFNGSLSYVPALVYLLGLGIYNFQTKKQKKFMFLAGVVTFLIALFFRTLDQAICPVFPIGTHFLWHIFNGVMLYLVTGCLLFNLKVNQSNLLRNKA